MNIEPASLSALQSYHLLTSITVPRPIAFVSTISADGIFNLAPFSFYTPICVKPPILCFSVGRRRGQKKDTIRNIEATKQFVVNVVSESLCHAVNQTSGNYPPEIDEFAVSGLTPEDSKLVKPPRVAEALASMECRLLEVQEFGDGPYSVSLVVGEVVNYYLGDNVYRGDCVDHDLLQAVGRMGRDSYCRTRDVFEMERPSV